MSKFITTLLLLLTASLGASAAQKLSNVVCFVKFADQESDEWEHDFDFYETLFNSTAEGANSVRNFYSDMSYGKLDWESVLVRTVYVDSHNRNYFLPKSTSNPDGYSSLESILGYPRLKTLVKDACAAIVDKLPSDVDTDGNDDGYVDNLVLVINGNSAISASNMLWPANNRNSNSAVTLGGAQVHNYLVVFDGANGYKSLQGIDINTGVLCHEMMHTLGAYDLYTSKSSVLNPVGTWDLMSDNGVTPQGFSAYVRSQYGRDYGDWLPESDIVEISRPGRYQINPISSASSSNVAYKIVPDPAKEEFFMIEYRDKTDMWDAQLPTSGLLVSRVHPGYGGNLGSDNAYELYIFRPGGSTTSGGTLSKAPLGPDTGRTSFGLDTDDDYPFYGDGTRAPFAITDVEANPDGSMSFNYSAAQSAISDIIGDPADGESAIYNLQGQRLQRIITPGLYIVNGEKRLVR